MLDLRRHYYEFVCGVRNLWSYFWVIWGDDCCDWSGMVRVWELQFRRRAEFFRKHAHHLHADRDAQHLQECAALCRRLLDDNYITNARATPWGECAVAKKGKRKGPVWVLLSMHQETQDQRRLGMLIGKYLCNWWD